MQTLVLEIASTFVADAVALVKGAGTVALHVINAPIEPVAKACDVEGGLYRRTTAHWPPAAGSDGSADGGSRTARCNAAAGSAGLNDLT